MGKVGRMERDERLVDLLGGKGLSKAEIPLLPSLSLSSSLTSWDTCGRCMYQGRDGRRWPRRSLSQSLIGAGESQSTPGRFGRLAGACAHKTGNRTGYVMRFIDHDSEGGPETGNLAGPVSLTRTPEHRPASPTRAMGGQEEKRGVRV